MVSLNASRKSLTVYRSNILRMTLIFDLSNKDNFNEIIGFNRDLKMDLCWMTLTVANGTLTRLGFWLGHFTGSR